MKTVFFTMEIALETAMRNYAGGLGVLAADMMLSASDLGTDIVCVTLFYHGDDDKKKARRPEKFLKNTGKTVEVEIENRKVKIAIYKKDLKGIKGAKAPVYFLSSWVKENEKWDRDLTKDLYAGDRYTRMCQEAILSVGGLRAIDALGIKPDFYHFNEGHTVFGLFELLKKNGGDADKVRKISAMTLHTPVAAGNEVFEYDLAQKTLPGLLPENIRDFAGKENLSMTHAGLYLCGKANSVSQKHNEVCNHMYPGFKFENITNGVCLKRWVHPKMAEIFDERIHGWRSEPERFLGAYDNIGEKEIAGAKIAMKKEFAGYINSDKSFFLVSSPSSADKFEPDILTVGFARRFVPYKRPTLLLRDLDKLADVAGGKLQVVYSSRCYPDDSFCNGEIEIMKRAAEKLRGKIRFALIPDYNPEIAKKILTGCDVWLNNPVGGREASGTSGMKAVLNGALNLSLLDGWWIEGYHADNLSGWGKECSLLPDGQPDDASDANSLYEMLNDAVDCYYNHKIIWAARMRRAIALASYFNTHRVVKEYERKMWNSGEKTASRLGSG